MSFPNDSVISPSLQDQLSDAHTRGFGFADAPAPDEPRHTFTEAEEQAMYAADMARRAPGQVVPRVPTGWHAATCAGCECGLLVQDGSGAWALCQHCAAAAATVA